MYIYLFIYLYIISVYHSHKVFQNTRYEFTPFKYASVEFSFVLRNNTFHMRPNSFL